MGHRHRVVLVGFVGQVNVLKFKVWRERNEDRAVLLFLVGKYCTNAGPGKQRGHCACQLHTEGLCTAQCNVFFAVGGVSPSHCMSVKTFKSLFDWVWNLKHRCYRKCTVIWNYVFVQLLPIYLGRKAKVVYLFGKALSTNNIATIEFWYESHFAEV